MSTVLVVSLGGTNDPVIHAIVETRPDFVHFLCSASRPGSAGSDESVEKVVVPAAKVPEGAYSIERVDRPDSLPEVFAACERIHSAIFPPGSGGAREVFANYTGGTKTMAVGLAVYALRAGWSLQVNARDGTRDNLTKITGGDLPILQDAVILHVRDALQLAGLHAARHDYEAAAETLALPLKKMRLGPDERSELTRLRTEYRMWVAWDRFDYDAALAEAQIDAGLRGRHSELLYKLIHTRRLCEGAGKWSRPDLTGKELVDDLIENARRCVERGRYDDAVGRLYRATELVAQLRLLRKHGIRTNSVDPASQSILPASAEWLQKAKGVNDKHVKLGLFDAYRLLGDLGDPVGAYFAAHQERLRSVLSVRNESLFAHGCTPITSGTWDRHGKVWLDWLAGAVSAGG